MDREVVDIAGKGRRDRFQGVGAISASAAASG